MMTIDVSKLKAGDVVLIELKVTKNDTENEQIFFFNDHYHNYLFTYKRLSEAIKEILPAPFDWEDAKPGMAFINESKNRRLTYYSGPYLFDKDKVLCCSSDLTPSINSKKFMTRASPEHDIEVPE